MCRSSKLPSNPASDRESIAKSVLYMSKRFACSLYGPGGNDAHVPASHCPNFCSEYSALKLVRRIDGGTRWGVTYICGREHADFGTARRAASGSAPCEGRDDKYMLQFDTIAMPTSQECTGQSTDGYPRFQPNLQHSDTEETEFSVMQGDPDDSADEARCQIPGALRGRDPVLATTHM